MPLKIAAHALPVALTVILATFIGALLPPLLSWAWLAILLAALVLPFTRRGQLLTARLLYRATPLNAAHTDRLRPGLTQMCAEGVGPPRVHILTAPALPQPVLIADHNLILIDARRLPAAGATSGPSHARLLAASHAAAHPSRRGDLALRLWARPGLTLGAIPRTCIQALPLAGPTLWRLRFTVFLAALYLQAEVGRWWLVTGILLIGVGTYAQPFLLRRWAAHEDALLAHGDPDVPLAPVLRLAR